MRYEKLFSELSKSSFRSKFHLRSAELMLLEKKGVEIIREHATTFVENRLASALPHNDGKQAPYRGHPVFVAQHATATCCRSCLLKWHNIKKNITLTSKNKNYIVDVIMEWIAKDAAKN